MPTRWTAWPTRWPQLVALSALGWAAACARPQPPERLAQAPELRIALVVGAREVRIGGAGRVTAYQSGTAQFHADQRAVTVAVEGRALRVEDPAASGRYQRLTVVSADPGGTVAVNGRRYRGAVELFVQSGGITAVNRVSLEDYLLGVVSAEMGRRTAPEGAALAAQAVVSRTYALRQRGRYAAQGFDLEAGVGDQAYGGLEAETPEGTAAVRATSGLVLTYRGQLALAFFHSTCGYATAAPSEAFRSIDDAPYLRSVSDRRPGGGYYCDLSPRFRWSVEWDEPTLRAILRRTVGSVLGIPAATVDQIRDVRVHHRGRSGRVTELRVGVGQGEIPIFGPDLRQVLLTPDGQPLGSTAVQLVVEQEHGRLLRLKALGAGWGHGVGFCQWGAVGRSRAGQNFRQILAAYFPGAEVQRWY